MPFGLDTIGAQTPEIAKQSMPPSAVPRTGSKIALTKYITEITGEFLALDTALSHLQTGDLCLILIDQVDEALAHIAKCVECA